jgi:RimJ/RimL family protein N-acetyltransferase
LIVSLGIELLQLAIPGRTTATTDVLCNSLGAAVGWRLAARFGGCVESPPSPSTIGGVSDFVPPDFDVPLRLETSEFVLEPLGPEHNEQDYDAWTSSMQHIKRTPGFSKGSWPREMTSEQNRGDLQRHADDFRNRTGFTYTVLDPTSRDVIGCVYIYPVRDGDDDASVLSWVRESHAHLDVPLWRAVSEWLASDWPFAGVADAPRT